MDAGDLISLLVFVGIFVFSLLKNKLKIAENRENRAVQNQAQTPAEVRNKQLKDEWNKQWENVLPKKKENVKKSSSPFLTTEMNTFGKQEGTHTQKKQVADAPNSGMGRNTAKSSSNSLDDFSFKTAEDARRAFIASEIWNRKYS